MTITYTYQYRFFPEKWKSPMPPSITGDEQKDLVTTLEYRRIIAPFLKNWLDVLNTWRLIIRYGIMPALTVLLLMGVGWSTFFMLLLIVSLVSLFIWAKQIIYQRNIAMIEIVIDTVLNKEFCIQLPKILESD